MKSRVKLPAPAPDPRTNPRVNVSKLKVQFGPTPSKPGSRLIDKKRKP